MAYQPPERNDDDAERLAAAELKLLALTVEKLVPLKAQMKSAERGFLADMDVRVCVLRQMPEQHQVQQLKELAWKYRRYITQGQPPKLPPHDPIVKEMEGRA